MEDIIEYAKDYIHPDDIEKYDWNIIASGVTYIDDIDCYRISSSDWVMYINKQGELMQFTLMEV